MTYDLNTVQSELGLLNQLLNVIADHMLENVDFVDAKGNRLASIDRLNALVFIGRDHSDRMVAALDANFAAIGKTTTEWKAQKGRAA